MGAVPVENPSLSGAIFHLVNGVIEAGRVRTAGDMKDPVMPTTVQTLLVLLLLAGAFLVGNRRGGRRNAGVVRR